MSSTKSNILGAILAIFSSIALFRLVMFIFLPANYVASAEISRGITTGHPALLTLQSRVLAPYMVKALSFIVEALSFIVKARVFGSVNYYVMAYIWFHIATVAIAAFLCWRLGRKYGGNDQSALLALTVFVACFALLLSPPWLHSWDFIDIIVFLVFIDFVLSGSSLPWFLGLFSIAIWNRDSAIFIALWLVLDPLARVFYQHRYKLPRTPFEWQRVLAGAICIAAGLMLAELLKRLLTVEAGFPGRYNLVFEYNMHMLKDSVTDVTHKFWIAVPAFLVMVTGLGAVLVRRDPQRYLTIYFIELSLLVALFLFGWFYETRIFLILIPFVVISAVLLSGSTNTGARSLEQ